MSSTSSMLAVLALALAGCARIVIPEEYEYPEEGGYGTPGVLEDDFEYDEYDEYAIGNEPGDDETVALDNAAIGNELNDDGTVALGNAAIGNELNDDGTVALGNAAIGNELSDDGTIALGNAAIGNELNDDTDLMLNAESPAVDESPEHQFEEELELEIIDEELPVPVSNDPEPPRRPDVPGASRLAAVGVGEVELRGEHYARLKPRPDPPPPGPIVLSRAVTVRPDTGGVRVRARYRIRKGRDSLFAATVVGPQVELREVTWNGRPVTRWASPQGPMVVQRLRADAVLEVDAFVPGDPTNGQSITMLEAPRGTVSLEGLSEEIVVSSAERPVVKREGVWSTGDAELSWAPKEQTSQQRGPLSVAHVGLGVTVGDAEVRGQARIRWEIRQGTRDAVSFQATGVGEDLTVEGPLVSRWERNGDQVQVELSGPTEGRVDLAVRWSIATPRGAEASVPLPSIVPDDVFRSTAAVQIARDGEVDVQPALARPWRAIAQVQLPEVAEGLVEGTPTVAYVRPRAGEGSDTLQLLRLEPVPGPPMVIDVADTVMTTTEEGRTLLRVRYEIRNERSSHLSVTVPDGMKLLGAEVAGRPVTVSQEGNTLQIPLKRSLETVKGLLLVPVTVALFADEQDAWARREKRQLVLPAVDAPVNVSRVTLHLPHRYENRVAVGSHGVVDWFSEGEGLGYGLGNDALTARADRLFARAVDAWNDNDFAGTQDQLDRLAELGASGTNPDGLQANVDLVMPPSRARPKYASTEPSPDEIAFADADGVSVYEFVDDRIDGDVLEPEGAAVYSRSSPKPAPPAPAMESAAARRIKARLRARSGKKKQSYDKRKRRAKNLKAAGRYREAAVEYRQAIEESRDLDALEAAESVEYDFEADELAGELAEIEAANQSAIQDLVSLDAELDLVGGVMVLLQASEDEELDNDALDDETAEPVMPLDTAPLVTVPEVGNRVRYEMLLLSAGEQREIKIDARRMSRRRWRRAGL